MNADNRAIDCSQKLVRSRNWLCSTIWDSSILRSFFCSWQLCLELWSSHSQEQQRNEEDYVELESRQRKLSFPVLILIYFGLRIIILKDLYWHLSEEFSSYDPKASHRNNRKPTNEIMVSWIDNRFDAEIFVEFKGLQRVS